MAKYWPFLSVMPSPGIMAASPHVYIHRTRGGQIQMQKMFFTGENSLQHDSLIISLEATGETPQRQSGNRKVARTEQKAKAPGPAEESSSTGARLGQKQGF